MITRVASRDGTEIRTSGDGSPLVLVHGTPADHTRWQPMLPHLEPHVTVHAIDRRGRGASGDGPEYRLEREYEDVAAVVDAVAPAGTRVDVYGHSHGGIVAFGDPDFSDGDWCCTRGGLLLPHWSSDGSRLAFSSTQEGD